MNIFVINLPSAIKRRKFQEDQLISLGLDYQILNAIPVDDINDEIYKKHYFDWQRPLKKTEVSCYFSHRSAWNKIIESNQPALILEDDALLSQCIPDLLIDLSKKQNIDLINLENRARKKFVAKRGQDITCHSKLLRLYQDRTGAAGYILWPSGAKKLIQCQQKKGIALADAHITACYNINAYQVEPTPIIQLDMCQEYGINNPFSKYASVSTVSSKNNHKGGFNFWIKRIFQQIKLGLYQLTLIIKSDRRYIKINNSAFLKKEK
jgi:glycosyl transferase family 25